MQKKVNNLPKEINKNKKKKSIITTLFFPVCTFRKLFAPRMLIIMASLISLKIIFSIMSIPIPGLGFDISIAYVPVMVMGWCFGPIVGLVLGFLSDTLTYFLVGSSSVWFWLYAIQEPLICALAGIMSGIYTIRINKFDDSICGKKTNFKWDVVFNQLIYFVFAITCFVVLILWFNSDGNFQHKNEDGDDSYYIIYKTMAFSLIALFLIIVECFTFYHYKTYRNNPKNFLLAIYATTLVVISMLIFSFALGPYSYLEYYKYTHNGLSPDNWQLYGFVYYLVPRVALESIKVPIEAFVLCLTLIATNSAFKNSLNNLSNSW